MTDKLGKAFGHLRRDGVRGLWRAWRRYLLLRAGSKLSVDTVTHQEAMKWFARRNDTYDELIDAVYPSIDRDGVIFDIGANIGYFTHRLTGKLDFRGSVYLFEPLPHLAELCRETFMDALFQTTVLNFGLSDEDTQAEIFVANNGNLGWNTLIPEKRTQDMVTTVITLHTFTTSGITIQPTFIKVDVEGAEYKVLRGMLDHMRRWQPLPLVLCEVGWGQTHPAWQEALGVFRAMEQLGYTICDLQRNPINIDELQTTTDILFVPTVGRAEDA